MPTINDTYINALLADAAYVDQLSTAQTPAALAARLKARMTPYLADFISSNFAVIAQAEGFGSSFEAVVWQGREGTSYAGQLYISMRGTQELPDFEADADLAATGLAHRQLADLVNWWMRETTPANQMAKQIAVRVIPGPLPIQNFVAAPAVQGAASLAVIGSIKSVNGHSLGGYLASSFVRLFGTQWPVEAINTFNSAGFSHPASINIADGFGQIAQILGEGVGLASFSNAQNNYFALNGINVTTNTWNPVGFRQYGTRVGLYQEDLAPQGINNHYMYKLTDLLALGNAIEKLDPSFNLSMLSAITNASSSEMAASYELALDAFRTLLSGPGITLTLTGDSNTETLGEQPASRRDFHRNLADLQESKAFQALAGHVRVDLSGLDLRAKARNDFSAMVNLVSLSPIALTATDAAGTEALNSFLQGAWGQAFTDWQTDRGLTLADRQAGKENYTDNWIDDRATLVEALIRGNKQNNSQRAESPRLPTDRSYELRWVDAAGTSQIMIAENTARPGGIGSTVKSQLLQFGSSADETITGSPNALGDHLYGGAGADTLNGLRGDDYLEGNADNDSLDGGEGNDTLVGGAGTDTYTFSGAFGHDTIIDSDGLGTITVAGYGTLVGASAGRVTSGSFKGDDPRVSYTVLTSGTRQDLVIRFADLPDSSITIRGWKGNAPGQAPAPVLNMTLAAVDAPDPATSNVATGTEAADEINWSGTTPAMRYVGLGGNDILRAVEPTPEFLSGAYSLAQYGSVLDGGEGDDSLLGGDGADVIAGGAGNDYVLGGVRTFTQFTSWYRTWGFDEATARAFIDQYFPQARREADANVIETGAGNDSVVGGWGDDVIDGGDDADVLWGLAGDDIVQGGAGDDGLRGDGDTRFFVTREFTDAQGVFHPEVLTIAYAPAWLQGQDVLDGGLGNDTLIGDGNNDLLYGGDGNDVLNGDARRSDNVDDDLRSLPMEARGDDRLDGGAGDDVLYGDAGDDTLSGGSGDDRLIGDDTQSRVAVAFHGDDMLDGGQGNDQLFGGAGDDLLDGGEGNDYLLGDGTDADVPASAHGDDFLDGGDGDDILLGNGGDDSLFGSEGNDQLDGGNGSDTLDGGRGRDVLLGGEGSDWLISDGNDYLDGGAGDDTYVVSLDPSFVAQVNDSQGRNTLMIDAEPFETTDLKLFTQDTLVLLAVGTQGVIAIGPDVSLASLEVRMSDGTSITLQELATRDGGAIASAVRASDGRLTDTASAAAALTLEGSARNDALHGSAFDDILRGRAGDDSLSGGNGSDWLEGGPGADRLEGGRGDDVLLGAGVDDADSGGNVYVFRVGDGHDTIPLGPGFNGLQAPSEFIEFGPGIDAASLTVRNRAAGLNETAAALVIDYGSGDSISFAAGAEARFAGIRFADGTVLGFDQVAALAAPVQPADGVLGGTGAADVLLGGSGDGQLFGNDGDDLLDGGAGRDLLVGGRGINRYRFAQGSGADAITPTPGERGQLQFIDTLLADLSAAIEGLDLVIRQPSGALVRLSNYLADAQMAATWSARGADGATIALGELLSMTPVTATPMLATRRERFIDSQFAQLGATVQRIDRLGRLVTPTAVERIEQQVDANGLLQLAPYLSTSTTVTRMTFTTEDPIYDNVTIHHAGTGAQFLSLAQLQGSDGTLQLPPGAQPVYGSGPRSPDATGGIDTNSTLIGYFVPGTPDTHTLEQRLVGWIHGTADFDVSIDRDTALQSIVSGSPGDDVITADGRFRGTISAGAGNDSVVLGVPWNLYDWFYSVPGETVGAGISLGRGVWVDAGTGDDTVVGSDGEDFIIGGAGTDHLAGMEGADTYYVSAADGGVDTIDDSVEEDRLGRLFETVSLAGAPNQDVVEFAADVSMSTLTFRWEDDPDVPDRRLLNFFNDGVLFLKVVYDAPRFTQARGEIQEFYFAEITQQLMVRFGGLALPGIELFRFADGATLRRDDLLQRLTVQPEPPRNRAPTLAAPLDDQSAQADVEFSVTVPNGTFVDPDAGDVLTFDAAVVGGNPLPSWLRFDPATRLLAGTPPTGLATTVAVRVTATDPSGAAAFDDFAIAVAAERSIVGSPGPDAMVGTTGRDLFDAAAGDDTLSGLAGNDLLDGGSGNDTMSGGPGDDVYVVDAIGDRVLELADAGDDLVRSAINWTLGSNIERLTLTGIAATSGVGNALNNVLTGNEVNNMLTGLAGDDWLDGGIGNDTLIGGAGNDTYAVDTSLDVITEKANEGNDLVLSSVSWTLGANLENLTLIGTSAINGTGNGLANLLIGNAANNTLNGAAGADSIQAGAGDDTLIGGAGADTLLGGAGNDTYGVDSTLDAVVEYSDEGVDTVQSSVDFTLGSNLENLTLTGSTATLAIGNALNNVLVGNGIGNTLIAGAGDDVLNGGAGADNLIGGAGDDSYVVNTAADVVTEYAGEGIDSVMASVTLTLAANVENLTLTGSANLNGTGNVLTNLIVGNAGNNTLDGAVGADTMRGGIGNDTYIVDDVGDMAIESDGEGTDLVTAGVTTTLWAYVENLTLTGTAPINGFGNSLNNLLTGNNAANALAGGEGDDTLDGGAGSDTMTGGTGNDSYVVNVATDVVIEGTDEGIDTVRSSVTFTLAPNVENLTLTGAGNTGATGNALDNVLTGNTGANALAGAVGNDTYIGGAGNDALNDTSTTSNDVYRWGVGQGNDTITDAGGNADRIEIGAGVIASQISLTRATNDLQIRIAGATDVLMVKNWYLGTANRIEEIRLADGSAINTGAAAPASLLGGMPVALRTQTMMPSAPTSRAFVSLDGDRAARLLVQAMAQFDVDGAAFDMPWREPMRRFVPFELLVPK